MWFDRDKQYTFNELFKIASEHLNLGRNEGLIATAFWKAFGAIALSSKNDSERNQMLKTDLAKLQAKYFEIAVQNSYEKNTKVPFLTAKVLGEQLIVEQGNYQYNFQPDLYSPNLSKRHNLSYCTVSLEIPPLSQKIIEGATEIHKYYSSRQGEFRRDLLYSSKTMNDHFIQAILAVADSKLR